MAFLSSTRSLPANRVEEHLPGWGWAARTHIGVAEFILPVGPDAGDGGRPGRLGEALGRPLGPHAMVAACFWAVEEA